MAEHWFGHCNTVYGFDPPNCYTLVVLVDEMQLLFVDGQVAVWAVGSVGNLTELVFIYDTNFCSVAFKFS